MYDSSGSEEKAIQYQKLMTSAMTNCYPVVTVKRKSLEDPWITDRICRKLRKERLYLGFKEGLRSGSV